MHSYLQERYTCLQERYTCLSVAPRSSAVRLSIGFYVLCVLLLFVIAAPASSQSSSPPAIPTNLTATAGDGSVSVAWDAVPGADSYQLYRSTTSGGPYTDIANLAGSTIAFMDGNNSYPVSNGSYYYVLCAVNSSGTSDYSSEAAVTLSVAAPISVSAAAGDGSVSLSWGAVTGGDYYQVYRASTSGGPYTYLAYLNGSTTAFTDGNASYPLANGSYYYVVRAGNNGGTSAYSNEASVTLGIAPPTDLAAIAGDGNVSLSWNAAAGADYYQLYRSTVAGGPYTYLAYLNSASTTFTDGNSSYPLADGPYYYVLRAGNNGGMSVYSDEATTTLSTAVPANLTATAGDGSVSLAWSGAAGADYYQVFRASTPGGPYSYLAYLNNATTTFTDGNASYPLANGSYYYVVRAGNNGGTSAYSNEASVTLGIAPPANLAATVSNGSTVNLTWGASPGADFYQLFRATTSGGPYNYLAYLNGSTQAFADNNLPFETPYFYVVRAGNNGGTSAFSNEAAIEIPFGLASLVVSPTSVAGGSGVAAYIYLNGPAPPGGATISLTSSDPSAPVPATVNIPAGVPYAYVPITTSTVTTETPVTISAAYNATSATATLTVEPLQLSDLQVSPAAVVGGNAATGYVYLNGPAPAGGLVVGLASSDPSVIVSPNVTVPAGASGTSFAISTTSVSMPTNAVVTASCGNLTKTAALTVNPLQLATFSISPGTVAGGSTSTGYLNLNGIVPNGSVTVQLSSSDPAVQVPASVNIPAGQSGASFTITTEIVSVPVQAVLEATLSGANLTAGLSVNPLQPTGVGINPNSVIGGNAATGYVYLNENAPAGGVAVNLSSGSAFASVPVSITVPQGASSSTFEIQTNNVDTVQSATITASLNSVSQSAALTITPANPMAPPVPTNLSVTPGDGAATISWTASAGADYYCVLRANTSGGPYTVAGYAYSPATTFTNTGLSDNTPYYYIVYAGNSNGQSANSQEVTTTLSLEPPTGLTASPGDGSVNLSWNGVGGADSYLLFRSATSGGPYTLVSGFGAGTTTCVDHGPYGSLQNGTYYYVLIALNTGGQSTYSNETSVTLSVAVPTGLNATAGDGLVNLSWQPTSGADSYQLFRSATSGGPYTLVSGFTSSTTSCVDRGPYGSLQNGTYYYVLIALNTGGQSAFSNEATVTLSVAVPTGLVATAGDGSVNLSWNGVGGADSYQLFRSATSGGPYTLVSGFGAGTTTCVDRGPYGSLQNGTYYYVLIALNAGGQSAFSNEASVTLSVAAPAGLTATAGDGLVNLSWQPTSGADSYQLFRSATSGGPYTLVSGFGSNTTSCVDRGPYGSLQNGTYYYVLIALNAGGQSTYSNEAAVTLSVAALTNLAATLIAGGAQLTWQAVLGADAYQAYRSTTPGGPYVYIGGTSANATTYTDQNSGYGLATGTYYYVVLAQNAGGQSTYSNEASLTVIPVVTGLAFSPNSVLGGGSVVGNVSMNGVSAADCIISLAGDHSAATLPATVTIPAGQTSVTFPISTTTVASVVSDEVTATYADLTTRSVLTIVPLLNSLTLTPNPVRGGSDNAIGSVTWNGPIPSGGAVISLSSDGPAVAVPATVTIPPGQTTVSFPATTSLVSLPTVAIVTASFAGDTQQASITVLPPALLSANAAAVTASISGGALGASTSSTISLTATNVTPTPTSYLLSVGSLPAGVTGWLSSGVAVVPSAVPANVFNPAAPGKTAVTLYLVVGSAALPGSYPIVVTASTGSCSFSTIATLTITP